MAKPKAAKKVEPPPPPAQDQVVLTTTLLGSSLQAPRYRYPAKVRESLTSLLKDAGDEAARSRYLASLESLIGHYQIFKSQDRELSLSESDAIAHLERTYKLAQALQDAYHDAWNYKAANIRLRSAWSVLKAADYAVDPKSYFNSLTGPDTVSRITSNLDELKRLLQWATYPVLERNDAGGRPTHWREVGFVQAFAALSREHFAGLSIRKKPLKPVLAIALAEVGWHHADIRPLLNKVEPSSPRNKPPG